MGSIQSGRVDIFSPTANGTTPPIASILTNGASLAISTGLAYDGAGTLYVAQLSPQRIVEYGPSASGNAPALRTIAGSATNLSVPYAVAIDPAGDAVVVQQGTASVSVYAAGANGNVAPIHTIAGPQTGMSLSGLVPQSVAVDGAGNIYVGACVNKTGGAIFVYAAGTYGNVAPLHTITGTATGINGPLGIAIGPQNQLYVANNKSNQITIFAAQANGNATPVGGFSTPTNNTSALAVDTLGNMYLIDQSGGFGGRYLVFGPNNFLIGTPLYVVSSPADQFSQTFGIAVR